MPVRSQVQKAILKSTMFTTPPCRAVLWFSQRLILICLLGVVVIAQGTTEEEMTEKGKPLLPCPDKPNCVSTIDAGESHAIAPFRYRKPLEDTKAVLKQIVNEFPRTALVKEQGGYLYFEVKSFLFQFVDDVEFWFDADTKTIHFRSASRSGYYDFGVNRRRMEEVRNLLEGKL